MAWENARSRLKQTRPNAYPHYPPPDNFYGATRFGAAYSGYDFESNAVLGTQHVVYHPEPLYSDAERAYTDRYVTEGDPYFILKARNGKTIGGNSDFLATTYFLNDILVNYRPLNLNSQGAALIAVSGSPMRSYIQDVNGNRTFVGNASNNWLFGKPPALNHRTISIPSSGGTATTKVSPQVVGGGSSATIWEEQPKTGQYWMRYLNQLLPENSGWDLQAAYDINDNGVIACSGWDQGPLPAAPQRRSCLLVPVELKDLKDRANNADDVLISNWATGQTITDANIAWIEAHSSPTDDAPRMPQLVFRVPNVPLEAKLLVEYERPYTGKRPDDTVRIPADGSFKTVANGEWEIWRDYNNLPFFGGDATLTYRISGGPETTIKFAIGGRNPEDSRCKAYTQGKPGAPWYAYAIEKHESESYNPGFYNQFWERNGNSSAINSGVKYTFTRGDPLVVRSAGETGVGGAGLAQVTGAGGVTTVPAPREVYWNWQKNVDSFLSILAGKIQIAETFMNDPNPRSATNPMPNGQRPQTVYHTGHNVPVPSRIQGRVTFGDNPGEKRPEEAVAIKAYNGATAHWCSWGGPSVLEWQFNYGNNNYVQAVGEQVE